MMKNIILRPNPIVVRRSSSAPRAAWADAGEYDKTAQELVHKFVANFAQFEAHVDEGVRNSAPVAA